MSASRIEAKTLGESNRGQQYQSIDAVGADQRHRVEIADDAMLCDWEIAGHAVAVFHATGCPTKPPGYTLPSPDGQVVARPSATVGA